MNKFSSYFSLTLELESSAKSALAFKLASEALRVPALCSPFPKSFWWLYLTRASFLIDPDQARGGRLIPPEAGKGVRNLLRILSSAEATSPRIKTPKAVANHLRNALGLGWVVFEVLIRANPTLPQMMLGPFLLIARSFLP